jgi:HAD superfamily hydrolase (TIGR01509 family)
MIKAICFDLDGVLAKTKDIHFAALNMALSEISEKYIITPKEHTAMFDGLKTVEKLNLLTEIRGLPIKYHPKIWKSKQEATKILLSEKISPSERLLELFEYLSRSGFKIACCSNSIRESTISMLSLLGLESYFDVIISNEDVKWSKPHPEMYWSAMTQFGVFPSETLIFEDSPPGLKAAFESGARVTRVSFPEQMSLEFVKSSISRYNDGMKTRWIGGDINILIPMAGRGSRFESAGYTFPKPLIDVLGRPMIQAVVDNLGVDGQYIFIVQSDHRKKYNLDAMLNLIAPNCKIVEVDGITDGAAVTTLLAKDLINTDTPLLIANSDQYIEWNPADFFYFVQEHDIDGAIVTFKSSHPKWSFAEIDENNTVVRVAEKDPISNNATAGIYYWRKGSDYVQSAEEMIAAEERVNGEFYVCPTYNRAISNQLIIKPYNIDAMWGLGTPEDLETFVSRKTS